MSDQKQVGLELMRGDLGARIELDAQIDDLLGADVPPSKRVGYWTVWRLRELGYPVEMIAAYLGVSVDLVREAMVYVRDRLGKGAVDIDEERALDLARVDRLLTYYLPQAELGDTQAGNFVVKLLSYRMRLLGLDRSVDVDTNKDFWTRIAGVVDLSGPVMDAEYHEGGGGSDGENAEEPEDAGE